MSAGCTICTGFVPAKKAAEGVDRTHRLFASLGTEIILPLGTDAVHARIGIAWPVRNVLAYVSGKAITTLTHDRVIVLNDALTAVLTFEAVTWINDNGFAIGSTRTFRTIACVAFPPNAQIADT